MTTWAERDAPSYAVSLMAMLRVAGGGGPARDCGCRERVCVEVGEGKVVSVFRVETAIVESDDDGPYGDDGEQHRSRLRSDMHQTYENWKLK